MTGHEKKKKNDRVAKQKMAAKSRSHGRKHAYSTEIVSIPLHIGKRTCIYLQINTSMYLSMCEGVNDIYVYVVNNCRDVEERERERVREDCT